MAKKWTFDRCDVKIVTRNGTGRDIEILLHVCKDESMETGETTVVRIMEVLLYWKLGRIPIETDLQYRIVLCNLCRWNVMVYR